MTITVTSVILTVLAMYSIFITIRLVLVNQMLQELKREQINELTALCEQMGDLFAGKLERKNRKHSRIDTIGQNGNDGEHYADTEN